MRLVATLRSDSVAEVKSAISQAKSVGLTMERIRAVLQIDDYAFCEASPTCRHHLDTYESSQHDDGSGAYTTFVTRCQRCGEEFGETGREDFSQSEINDMLSRGVREIGTNRKV